MKRHVFFGTLALLAFLGTARAQDDGWKHSGSIYIITTVQGADLPAGASEKDFPLLVRLDKDWFNFSEAKANGEDIRFATSAGADLPYQIEQWDAANGTASIWVRIPVIKGDARQEIRLRWGNPAADSQSDPKAVFNESNGYVGVWHMGDPVADDAGTVESKDTGTTDTAGVIGRARRFPGGKGIFCGDVISNYPTGAAPHSTQAWFKPEKVNGIVVGWGKEQAQGKVIMKYASPPHVSMDCYFSAASIESEGDFPRDQWVQVVHTWQEGDTRIYVNGVLAGQRQSRGAPLNIERPARLWIGGWYNNFSYVGDIDEVRISKVVRSAEWVRLEYENQKPMQTLVGPVVQQGDAASLSVTPERLTVQEGAKAAITAKLPGAQKIYWTVKRDGKESIAAVDRSKFTFDAGRVTADVSLEVILKAVYAGGVKTRSIPVTIKEAIPEPQVTLRAPAAWDGRKTIEVQATVANLAAMKAGGAGELNYKWDIDGMATIRRIEPGKLILTRAQNSGKLTVTAAVDNGGEPGRAVAEIQVTEPARDKWVERTPDANELPEDNQFYARDDEGQGTIWCTGKLPERADSVTLKVFCDGKPYTQASAAPAADGAYVVSANIKAGLVKYRIELAAKRGSQEAVLGKADNLLCGDAYLIDGQSNAVTEWGSQPFPETSEWIRSFGCLGGDFSKVRFGPAIRKAQGGVLTVGYWGFDLARHIVETHKVPVFVINGAVGGTRVDQHQRNEADPEDALTIYGRLLKRVRAAHLTHGIRGVLWHQGENDQGSDGPTGGFGWETYRRLFIDMAGAWKRDYPNIQHYYVFQIWPKSCSMGRDGSDNVLREVQRTLSRDFSNLSVMTTLGIRPPGTCHYPAEGYAAMAKLIEPLVDQYNYGQKFAKPISAADLQSARYASPARDKIVLTFDQPVVWADELAGEFYLDGKKGLVESGSVAGNVLTLKVKAPSDAGTITYLDSAKWSQDRLLVGTNGIAALTFCDVPVSRE
jgi:hypothetical protein